MQQKKTYLAPQMQIDALEQQDIVTTSSTEVFGFGKLSSAFDDFSKDESNISPWDSVSGS